MNFCTFLISGCWTPETQMKAIKEIHDNLTAGTDHETTVNIIGSINLKVRKN